MSYRKRIYGLGIWGLGLGYYLFYTPYSGLTKALSQGLLPGVGSIGWGHHTDYGFAIDQPLLRGANADVNLTLAMALVFVDLSRLPADGRMFAFRHVDILRSRHRGGARCHPEPVWRRGGPARPDRGAAGAAG